MCQIQIVDADVCCYRDDRCERTIKHSIEMELIDGCEEQEKNVQ